MAIADDITSEINTILDTTWDVRDGTVIPDTDSITLKNGAVKIDATFLYADLAGSSKLARFCQWQTTAKVIRAYLNTATRLIKYYGGEIRSFDGDRVMGVFIGNSKNTNAVRCALAINWTVTQIINVKAREKYSSIRDNNLNIQHCIGIDTGESRAVRAGIRNNNDLIWIGRPPSFAAKLSDVREHPYSTFISRKVYDAMNEDVKYTNDGNRTNMWYSGTVTYAGNTESICKSSYYWKP